MIYLDNSATTRPYESVVAKMAEVAREQYANASALYRPAVEAERHLRAAKEQIARMLRCTPAEVLLTPGGTVANNLALLGAAEARRRRGNRVVLSAVEHPSVSGCGKLLEGRGFEVIYAAPDSFADAINSETVLAAMMLVNNETGERLPVEAALQAIRRTGAPAHFHIDGVQAFCRVPCNVSALGCDSLSVSAHKICGPKGIGALYLKKGTRLAPILIGGAQEGGMVPGTYNTPAAAGFAEAIRLYRQEDLSRYETLRARFLEKAAELPFLRINSPADGAPYILNFSCMGYLGENVLHFLEEKEIYVSQGAACSSNKARSESVLGRLGYPEPVVMGAIRVSFGVENTIEDVDALLAALKEVPDRLQKRYKDVK